MHRANHRQLLQLHGARRILRGGAGDGALVDCVGVEEWLPLKPVTGRSGISLAAECSLYRSRLVVAQFLRKES